MCKYGKERKQTEETGENRLVNLVCALHGQAGTEPNKGCSLLNETNIIEKLCMFIQDTFN